MIVLHSYSTKNSGDGLLVDLAVEVAKDTGQNSVDKMIALDKDSFVGFDSIYEPVIIKGSFLSKISYSVKCIVNVVKRVDIFDGYLPVESSDAVFAVGGGYMRGRTFIESVKTFLAHVPQLLWSSRQKNCPVIYLPQSIGPFSGLMKLIVKNSLSRVDLVCARDDLTVAELGLDNVIRVPDLAVQELAMSYGDNLRSNHYEKIYLIARSVNVPGQDEYISRLIKLKELIPNIEPLVQSEGRGNNDVAFYNKLGWTGEIRRVKDVLAQSENKGVVISVRLHGSLQSMISGCPSIHLSYERKGFGAFSDLGISEYCHGFKSFDPEAVAGQANELCKDSSEYWNRIGSSINTIKEKRAYMIAEIKKVLGRYKK
jgi:polysaccharide pyruvyl transferase WcaK-like protein